MHIFGAFKAFPLPVIGLQKTVHWVVGIKAFALPMANHKTNIDWLK